MWTRIKTTMQSLKKSWTIWFGSILTALPIALPIIQEFIPSIKDNIPALFYDQAMVAVGSLICALRVKTAVQAVKKQE